MDDSDISEVHLRIVLANNHVLDRHFASYICYL
jgi:hypothetical protein